MRISRRIKVFVALIALLYLITSIQSTYAKYVTSANTNTDISIARWNVLINDQDIKLNSNFGRTIEPTIINNDNIAEGVIAPTSIGYFDLILNGASTDVSFQYNIVVTSPITNTVNDLRITKYTIDDDPTEYEYSEHIFGNINLNDTVKIKRFRLYFEWYEGEGEIMSNQDDTQQTITGTANFNINVNVIQTA